MSAYTIAPAVVNLSALVPAIARPWSLRARLRRVWDRNPNARAPYTWSKYRAKIEHRVTRGLDERPVLIAGLERLATGTGDPRARQIAERLVGVTPAALGLMWYTPRPRGGGTPRGRWYVPRRAWPAVRAFITLTLQAYALLNEWSRRAYVETTRLVAGLARAMRRDLRSDPPGDPPHPPFGGVSTSRDSSCTSARPIAEWLRQLIERHGGAAPAEAM